MTTTAHTPRYRILVEGTLDPTWSEYLANLDIAVREQIPRQPISVLTGPLSDQGALHGVLDTLFMLNMPLIGVERCSED